MGSLCGSCFSSRSAARAQPCRACCRACARRGSSTILSCSSHRSDFFEFVHERWRAVEPHVLRLALSPCPLGYVLLPECRHRPAQPRVRPAQVRHDPCDASPWGVLPFSMRATPWGAIPVRRFPSPFLLPSCSPLVPSLSAMPAMPAPTFDAWPRRVPWSRFASDVPRSPSRRPGACITSGCRRSLRRTAGPCGGSSRRPLGIEHLERLGVPMRGGARVQAPGLGRVSANAPAADVEQEREIVVAVGILFGRTPAGTTAGPAVGSCLAPVPPVGVADTEVCLGVRVAPLGVDDGPSRSAPDRKFCCSCAYPDFDSRPHTLPWGIRSSSPLLSSAVPARSAWFRLRVRCTVTPSRDVPQAVEVAVKGWFGIPPWPRSRCSRQRLRRPTDPR